MLYLAFIVASGLYVYWGPANSLHQDGWFRTLQRRVDAIEPAFWLGFLLLIGVPVLVVVLGLALIDSLLGGLVYWLVALIALLFAFGRGELLVLLDGVVDHFRVQDLEAAALLMEQHDMFVVGEDADDFTRNTSRMFSYALFEQWFAPVFYFLLLGPAGAVGYRLIRLSVNDKRVPVRSLCHLADWLPSRLLVMTIALVGYFDGVKSVLVDGALDADLETDEFLLRGVEASQAGQVDDPAEHVFALRDVYKRAFLAWVVVISVITLIMA